MNTSGVKGWLLDTHALLWMLHGDPRLSPDASAAIDGKLPVFHSTASFWEISIKLGHKGFDFQVEDDWHLIYPKELQRIGVSLLVPHIEDCRLLQDLPKYHGDPFDRMLVCQATRHRFGIISADSAMDAYGIERVW